ncbi:hypothetical protein SLEP1_g30727 [Rubroshorea leprosula]|uniref:Uncharacterized protein n=1 Tax=Rubroshorea leprosula TaxID=152421 RepID=A0AAV5K129_9ROSI|nr:hypothetical protein SLEP1_g30727 [Rubroshorea leprosula]
MPAFGSLFHARVFCSSSSSLQPARKPNQADSLPFERPVRLLEIFPPFLLKNQVSSLELSLSTQKFQICSASSSLYRPRAAACANSGQFLIPNFSPNCRRLSLSLQLRFAC